MTSAEADISLFARKRKRRRLPVAEEPALNDQHCAALAQPCDERPAEATPAAGESEDDGTSFKDLGVSEWLCRCAPRAPVLPEPDGTLRVLLSIKRLTWGLR